MDKQQSPSPRKPGRPKKQIGLQQHNELGLETLEREKARSERVCRELLEGYTDDFVVNEDKSVSYSESSVAEQWGVHRGKITRIISAIYVIKSKKRGAKAADLKTASVPQLVPVSLAELVEILGSLIKRKKPKKPLTKEDSLRIIQRFVELEPEERATLKFNPKNYNAVIQQVIRIIELDDKGDHLEEILKFYDALLEQTRDFFIEESAEDAKISELVKEIFKKLCVELNEELVSDFTNTVKDIKARIETDSGLAYTAESKTRLTGQFIKFLTQAVVENKILTKEFPIYVKYFDIKKVRPLPLLVEKDEQRKGLLNSYFNSLIELMRVAEKQYAHTISLHFYVKTSESFKDSYNILFPDDQDFKESTVFNFYIESSGTGGKITHLARLVSLSLLKDMPCLEKYFPVAHDIVLITPGVLKENNSNPLLYHTLTVLCEKKHVEKAVKLGQSYTTVCSDQQAFYGNYCGFDLIECAIKSALFARLRAIKKAGIDSTTYLTEFCNRAERSDQLRKALSYLKSYPFSVLAMQSHLEKTIFYEALAPDSNQIVSILDAEIKPSNFQQWSDVAREAYLELIDAYLTEGLYKSADKLIKKIKIFMEDSKISEIMSSTIRIKFEICLARYFSIAVGINEDNKADPNEYTSPLELVKKALSHLDNAERLLAERQEKYATISERAQSNFSPFYSLHAKISFFRAKLHLFYLITDDQYLIKDIKESDVLVSHLKPVYLLEKARIFAAMDGNAEFYSYYSAYQAIAYTVAAFLLEKTPSGFSKVECLDWASRLIEHALICYSEVGNDSYQKIKEKSGIGFGDSNKEDMGVRPYGKYEIQNIPSIREIPKSNERQLFYFRNILEKLSSDNQDNQKFIFLDMEALSVRASDLKHFEPTQLTGIYLFGTYSSVILFARGLHALCTAAETESFFVEVELASRMFTYAWASAEDGCISTTSDESDGQMLKLERRFFAGEQNRVGCKSYDKYWEDYYSKFSSLYQQEIAYIRDIYPHRVTEIADFGKIFAALCKFLLLHCGTSNGTFRDCPESIELERDIGALMDRLHSDFSKVIDKPDYRSGQNSFNGRFSRSFKRINDYLADRMKEYAPKPEKIDVKQLILIRDEIVKQVFRFLFEQSGRNL